MPSVHEELTAAVVVPTFRRADCLERCLRALQVQTRRPDRIVVVVRQTDEPSLAELDRLRKAGLEFEIRLVDVPGQAAAIEAGVAATTEAVVAHVDDDTAASRTWLEGLLGHYAPEVGGVGGRDVINGRHTPGTQELVGTVTWYGRPIGNHHEGSGSAREVDVLKNANISLRRELWVIDRGLRGVGAQTHLELDVCLRARARGWKLIYDPTVTVDHFPAPRYDGDGRGKRQPEVTGDVAFNATYAMTKHMPPGRLLIALAYGFTIGSRAEPGLLLAVQAVARHRASVRESARTLLATTRGRVAAVAAGGKWRRREPRAPLSEPDPTA